MATPAQIVVDQANQDQEYRRKRQEDLEDDKRKATLKALQEDATTPQDKVAAIDAVYHQDPSVLRQHVENLTRRITGKPTQPVVNPQQAQQKRVADLTARGEMPEQQNLSNTKRVMDWIKALPPDQQRTALQLLGIHMTSKFQNFRNPKTGETMTWDTSEGTTPGPDWVLAGTSSGMARSLGYGLSSQDAIKAMQATGQQFAKPDGSTYTPQELASLPPSMQLRAFAVGDKVYYGVANETQHTVTFGNQVYKMDQFGGVDTSAPLGVSRVPTTHASTTTDPFGVTSTTSATTTPVTPNAAKSPATGQAGAPAPRANAVAVGTSASAPAVPAGSARKGPAPRKRSQPAGASRAQPGTKSLDATGHIPATAANSQLVQAANSIIDGMDVDKLPIPQRDRAAAMALASEYGWKGQGLFTPRESLQLREGASVIQNMLNSDALKVLDQGTIGKLPMLGQSADPTKASIWGRLTTSLAASAATPQQQEFMRYWRQLDALAVGLRGLVQTGRATQAQVDRIIAELPNPYNTTSSADAKSRLRMVQNELRIAAESGKLPDVPLGDKKTAPPSAKGNVIVVSPEDMK